MSGGITGLNAHERREQLRAYWSPEQVADRIEQDRLDAEEVCAGMPCPDPDCAAEKGEPCFGADARCTHPARAIAYYDARLSGMVARGEFT